MRIEIEGKSYLIDKEMALENGCLKEIVQHKIGNVYVVKDDDKRRDFYILAQTNVNTCILICIKSEVQYRMGQRYEEPVKCCNLSSISSDEWSQICGGNESKFRLVEIEYIICK